jgi:hypothetical protein
VDIAAVASAIGQVASGALAIPTTFVAYFAYRTSQNTAAATEALTAIENARWHAEMCPVIELDSVLLDEVFMPIVTMKFVGPASLPRIDEVRVNIRQYREFRDAEGRVTIRDEAPLQFNSTDQGDSIWECIPFPLVRGMGHSLLLQRASLETLYDVRRVLPLRLTIECRHGDHEPWTIPANVIAPAIGWWPDPERHAAQPDEASD